MNHYKTPKAKLDNTSPRIPSKNAFWIVFKVSFYGTSVISLSAGLFVFVMSYPGIDVSGLFVFAVFFMASFIVSFSLTLTYGKAIEYVMVKLGFKNKAAYVLAALLPSLLIIANGYLNSRVSFGSAFFLALVIAAYAIPIALFGYRFTYASHETDR